MGHSGFPSLLSDPPPPGRWCFPEPMGTPSIATSTTVKENHLVHIDKPHHFFFVIHKLAFPPGPRKM